MNRGTSEGGRTNRKEEERWNLTKPSKSEELFAIVLPELGREYRARSRSTRLDCQGSCQTLGNEHKGSFFRTRAFVLLKPPYAIGHEVRGERQSLRGGHRDVLNEPFS